MLCPMCKKRDGVLLFTSVGPCLTCVPDTSSSKTKKMVVTESKIWNACRLKACDILPGRLIRLDSGDLVEVVTIDQLVPGPRPWIIVDDAGGSWEFWDSFPENHDVMNGPTSFQIDKEWIDLQKKLPYRRRYLRIYVDEIKF